MQSCCFSLYVYCINGIATKCTRFIEDLPLLNTKWMLPNFTIVLSLCFILVWPTSWTPAVGGLIVLVCVCVCVCVCVRVCVCVCVCVCV